MQRIWAMASSGQRDWVNLSHVTTIKALPMPAETLTYEITYRLANGSSFVTKGASPEMLDWLTERLTMYQEGGK